MNKEHIFTIGVNIDDDAINRGIIAGIEKQVVDGIKNDLFDKDFYGQRTRVSAKLLDKLTGCINNLVEKDKDYILDAIIKNATEKLMRSKAFREKFAEFCDEVKGNG